MFPVVRVSVIPAPVLICGNGCVPGDLRGFERGGCFARRGFAVIRVPWFWPAGFLPKELRAGFLIPCVKTRRHLRDTPGLLVGEIIFFADIVFQII